MGNWSYNIPRNLSYVPPLLTGRGKEFPPCSPSTVQVAEAAAAAAAAAATEKPTKSMAVGEPF